MLLLSTKNKKSSISGLHLNLGKTEVLTIGSLKYQRPNVDPRIKWPTEPIRYLGIYIGYNFNVCYKMNWTNKLTGICIISLNVGSTLLNVYTCT